MALDVTAARSLQSLNICNSLPQPSEAPTAGSTGHALLTGQLVTNSVEAAIGLLGFRTSAMA